jgi:hypothetical protein
MKTTIELAPTPYGEDCAQVGTDDYGNRALKECKRFLRQLKRQFPIPTELEGQAEYFIKRNPHDEGSYLEVALRFDSTNSKAMNFALKVETKSPEHWDEEAKVEMAIENGWFVRITNAPVSYDGGGTVTAETFDLVEKGHPYRGVLINSSHLEWHAGRYGSEMFPMHTESEWQDVKELVENRVKKGR